MELHPRVQLEVVRHLDSGEQRVAQLCREHQIDESPVRRWRQEVAQRGPAAFSPDPVGAAHRRVGAGVRAIGDGTCHPHKGGTRGGVAERQAMIATLQAESPTVSVRQRCHLLGISRSWVYTQRQRSDQPTTAATAFRDAIEQVMLAFPGSGYRRVTKAVQRDGWLVNHKRVLRVMRQESLLCQLKRRVVVTTDSAHGQPTSPNRLRGQVLTGINHAWVAAITSIRLPTAFVSLACILDAWLRRYVGWELSRRIDTTLTLAALEQAIALRQPAPGLIHHSDRGVHDASQASVERLGAISAQISMAATGNPYENAQAESFFKTLKREEVYLNEDRTFAEAEANLGHFIEAVYNQKRFHSSLGYCPPMEFEQIQVEDDALRASQVVRYLGFTPGCAMAGQSIWASVPGMCAAWAEAICRRATTDRLFNRLVVDKYNGILP